MFRIFISFMLTFFIAALFAQSDAKLELEQAQLYYDEGKNTYYDGNYRRAELLFDSCLVLRKQNLLEPHILIYKVKSRIANNYIKQRKLQKAKGFLDSALDDAVALFGEQSDEVAGMYMDLATYSSKLMRNHEALEYNKKAIGINTELYGADSEEVAYVLMNSGVDLYKQGDYVKCVELYEGVLKVYKKTLEPNDENFNRVYNNAGMAYRKLGDVQKSLEYAEKALEIKLKNYPGDHPSVAKYYSNLAKIQSEMQRFDKSKINYEKSIDIYKKRYGANHSMVAGTMGDMATLFADNGNLEGALVIYQATAPILEADKEDNFLPYIAGLFNIATVKDELGQTQEAISDVKTVNKIFLESGKEDDLGMLNNNLFLSMMFRHEGMLDSALVYISKAKLAASKLSYFEDNFLIRTKLLVEESKVSKEKNTQESLVYANELLQKAIALLVEIRKSYVSSGSKKYINETLENIFSNAVEVSYALYRISPTKENAGFLFANIEKAKAASFWDNESEENAFYYGKVPKSKLAEIEFLKENIGDLQYELNYLEGQEVQIMKDSLFETKRELEYALKDLEKSFPEFYRLKYELNVPALSDVQSHLEDDIALIDYFIYDDNLITLLILNNSFEVNESQIASKAFDLQQSIGYLNPEINGIWYNALFGEIEPILKKEKLKRISIIPHDVLNYLSFDQLVNPKTKKSLLYEYAFSYQHSASSIVESVIKRNNLSYLGFAPEWATIDDESQDGNFRSELIALPGAALEVEKVSALLGGKVLKGENASEKNFKQEAAGKDILHFATHAQVDPDNETKSCLFLIGEADPFKDDDGKLYINEITDEDISAQLVILSACNTGNGKLSSGEGIMSLARAFRYAGAESLMMSLWLANDQSSLPIVTKFVENIKNGMTKDLALQQSKISFLSKADPMMQDEFYWAGFQINGNIDPMVNKYIISTRLLAWLFILGTGVLTFFFLKRKSKIAEHFKHNED